MKGWLTWIGQIVYDILYQYFLDTRYSIRRFKRLSFDIHSAAKLFQDTDDRVRQQLTAT